MPLFGPPDVATLAAKRDVLALIKALGYQKDGSVRKAAARALGDTVAARSVGDRYRAVKTRVWSVRTAPNTGSRIGPSPRARRGRVPHTEGTPNRGPSCWALSHGT